MGPRQRTASPQRRRADGTFEAVDWDTAIREVAERLGQVRAAHGGESIVYHGSAHGDHLGAAHARATRAALGSVFTLPPAPGARLVDGQLYGRPRCHPSGDFEHAEVVVGGEDPRARVTLQAIAADPARALVVIDAHRTETAALADYHLQIRPGTGAFCLSALVAALVDEDLVDHAFLRDRTRGFAELRQALAAVPIAEHCAAAGVPEPLVREVARRLARAASVAVLERREPAALGTYLAKLVYLLTGNFGKPGAMNLPTRLASLGDESDVSLGDHPLRLRAMIVAGADPASSLGREALSALDLLVVLDSTVTETARLAHYVLPTPSRDEQWEASFLDVGFPRNVLQLRAPLLEPPPGALPEPEIHRRLVRALGALRDEDLAELRASTRFMRLEGRGDFADAFFQALAARPHLIPLVPIVLYETLGRSLPDGAAAAAVLWSAAHQCASTFPESVRRAGFSGESHELGEQLFDAILMERSGVTFSVDTAGETWQRLDTPDRRVRLVVPELLAELAALGAT